MPLRKIETREFSIKLTSFGVVCSRCLFFLSDWKATNMNRLSHVPYFYPKTVVLFVKVHPFESSIKMANVCFLLISLILRSICNPEIFISVVKRIVVYMVAKAHITDGKAEYLSVHTNNSIWGATDSVKTRIFALGNTPVKRVEFTEAMDAHKCDFSASERYEAVISRWLDEFYALFSGICHNRYNNTFTEECHVL